MGTVTGERGNESTADEPMYIHLYPNGTAFDSECENSISTRMKNICDELFDFNSIDYYKIIVRYDHPNLDSSSLDTYWNEFNDWYEAQNYDDEIGAHVGVTGNFDSGYADEAWYSGNSSFTQGDAAVLGTNSSKERFSNVAIQETLHTFIRGDLQGVQELIRDGPPEDGHEHDLGHVYSSGFHPVSPMATGYEGGHSTHGTCDKAPGWGNTYKASLTNCTKDAVGHTADKET
jgi:hypothetical protein